MNEEIKLSLTQQELDAIEAVIRDSGNRGIVLSPAAVVRAFMWMGIHTFGPLCAQPKTPNEPIIREIDGTIERVRK